MPKQTRHQSTKRLAEAAEKRKLALELRLAGMNYRDIAEEVGWKNQASAYKAVEQELAAIPRQEAKQLLVQELERLDVLQLGHWAAARNGDAQAANVVFKAMDMRAKLAGLYDGNGQEDQSAAVLEQLTALKSELLVGGDDGYGDEFVDSNTGSAEESVS